MSVDQDVEAAVKTYHYLSERWFTHASPTLFNAGTPRPQLSSCFLVAMKNDSIEVNTWFQSSEILLPQILPKRKANDFSTGNL